MDEKLVVKERQGVKDIVTRKMGLLSVVGMYYAMCCAGAYGVEEMIPDAGPGLTILILVALPLVWALPYSYICAELGSARPSEGGKIMWVKEALGEFWYAIMVLLNFIWGLVANTIFIVLATNYLAVIVRILWGYTIPGPVLICVGVGLIALFFIINILGLKEVSIVSTVLSIAIVIAFSVVTIVGLAHWSGNPLVPFISGEYGEGTGGFFGSLGAAFAIGIWMYSGFDEISMVAGEIKDSNKTIPRALMIVIPLMMATYILPSMAGLASIGDWANWTTEPDGVGYAHVLSEYVGPVAGAIFGVVAIIGQCSIFNVCITTASRSALIWSDENFGPKSISKLTKKKGVPWVGLTIVALVTTLLFVVPYMMGIESFTLLIVIDVFFALAICTLVCVSALILKKKIPAEEFGFKAPGGPVLHKIMCVVVISIAVIAVLVNGLDYFVGGLWVAMALPLIYMVCKWAFKGATVKEPEAYPVNPKTRLGFGDLARAGYVYICIGLFANIARFFIHFYEKDWGPGYAEVYEDILADPEGYEYEASMVEDYGLEPNADGEVWIPGYYEETYNDGAPFNEGGIFGNWEGMLNIVTISGIISICMGIALLIISKVVGDKKRG